MITSYFCTVRSYSIDGLYFFPTIVKFLLFCLHACQSQVHAYVPCRACCMGHDTRNSHARRADDEAIDREHERCLRPRVLLEYWPVDDWTWTGPCAAVVMYEPIEIARSLRVRPAGRSFDLSCCPAPPLPGQMHGSVTCPPYACIAAPAPASVLLTRK